MMLFGITQDQLPAYNFFFILKYSFCNGINSIKVNIQELGSVKLKLLVWVLGPPNNTVSVYTVIHFSQQNPLLYSDYRIEGDYLTGN